MSLYHLETNLPAFRSELPPRYLEDLFETFCDNMMTGTFVFSKEFELLDEKLQDILMKDLAHFLRDNDLHSKLFMGSLYKGKLTLNLKSRRACVDLYYHRTYKVG